MPSLGRTGTFVLAGLFVGGTVFATSAISKLWGLAPVSPTPPAPTPMNIGRWQFNWWSYVNSYMIYHVLVCNVKNVRDEKWTANVCSVFFFFFFVFFFLFFFLLLFFVCLVFLFFFGFFWFFLDNVPHHLFRSVWWISFRRKTFWRRSRRISPSRWVRTARWLWPRRIYFYWRWSIWWGAEIRSIWWGSWWWIWRGSFRGNNRWRSRTGWRRRCKIRWNARRRSEIRRGAIWRKIRGDGYRRWTIWRTRGNGKKVWRGWCYWRWEIRRNINWYAESCSAHYCSWRNKIATALNDNL